MGLGASLRLRESRGETESFGPVNLKHADFGKCTTVIWAGSVSCACGIRSNGSRCTRFGIGFWPCYSCGQG